MDKVRYWPLILGAAALGCGGTVGSGSAGRRSLDPPGTGDASAAGGSSSVDGGVIAFDCPSYPPASEKGQGLCAPPVSPPQEGSPCACWDVANAPGVDQCPPSTAAQYGTPCCVAGSCAFDFGDGCTTFPLPLPNAVAPPPACSAPPSVPGLVESGFIQHATTNTTSVYFLETDNIGRLVRIGKSDCARTLLKTDSLPFRMEATESGLFIVTQDAVGSASLAEILEGTTTQVPVPLSDLLGGTLTVEAMGSDGSSLYAVIAHQADPNDPASYHSALIEVPCCGEAPRFLGATKDTFGDPEGRLVRDGDFLYWLTTDQVLDVGPMTSLVRFNVSTGGADIVLDRVHQSFPIFDVVDGLVYLGGDGGISTLQSPGCLMSALLGGRAAALTAFAHVGSTVFWTESAPALAFSQIFTRPTPGGTPTRLADTPGHVDWLSADATHVYWLASLDVGGSQLLRIARP